MANHFRSTERQESDGEETLFQPEPTTAAVTPQVIDDAAVDAVLPPESVQAPAVV